ncbi:MAG: DedA family protein, partial [Mycetocola sp.]
VTFGLLTAAGSLIWNSIFVVAGFLLGENWAVVLEYADVLKYVVVGGVVVLVVWWTVRMVLRQRARRRVARSATSAPAGVDDERANAGRQGS